MILPNPRAEFKRAALACALILAFPPITVAAERVEFANEFMRQSDQQLIDLSRFSEGNPVTPGIKRVDLWLNGHTLGRAEVRFAQQNGQRNAEACIDAPLLASLGLKEDIQMEAQARLSEGCISLPRLLAGARAEFDSAEQRLELSVPQASLSLQPRGYVDPQSWDSGVNAAFVNYRFNHYQSRNGSHSNSQDDLSLTSGINLGMWRLRNQSALHANNGDIKTQNLSTYLQRSLPTLGAELTVGDAYTRGDLFDSYGFRGVELASDDRMLPTSQRGFAPVVRGVARTNAKVTVSQQGRELYSTTVAPGAFEISDLYPTGYGGDLDVRISEADGSEQSFTVPYQAVAQLLRPGQSRYRVTAGTLRTVGGDTSTPVAQATWQQGLNNSLTAYAGAQGAQDYSALMAGAAMNTVLGAMALDMTQARAAQGQTGGNLRASLSRTWPTSDTSMSLVVARALQPGYLGLNDALSAGGPSSLEERIRDRVSLNLSQNLGDSAGSLYLSASLLRYWYASNSSTSYQLGYSNHYERINYSLNAQQQRDSQGQQQRQVMLTASVPLDRVHPSLYLDSALTKTSDQPVRIRNTLHDSVGADQELSYSVSTDVTPDANTSDSLSANANYQGRNVVLDASLSRERDYRQSSFGAAGSVVLHPGGVTLGQTLGDTIAVVEAPGASGARVSNATGVRLDGRGYAVVPYLTPYSSNSVDLDPKGLPLSVELQETSQRVVPTAGAVLMVKFASETGQAVLIEARLADGSPLPFGSELLDAQGASLAQAGQGGFILTRGLADGAPLTLRWGARQDQQCATVYRAPPGDQAGVPYAQAAIQCQLPAASTEITE